MINEISPHTFNNKYKHIKPKNNDIALIYLDNTILLRQENQKIFFPTIKDLLIQNLEFRHTFLFSIDNINYFLINFKMPIQLPKYNFSNISILRDSSPKYKAFAGITGNQLLNWYRKNKFCGVCGTKMYHSHNSRSMICPICKDAKYPFLAPAVIVGIINEDKILLTKYSNRNFSKYALIAGYTEIGENIEETVKREVFEEVGLEIKNIRYYKSQPWSFSSSLLFGFFCNLEGTDNITLDENELSEAKWFKREDIPVENSHISLTSEMIQYFKNNKV